MRRLLIVVPVAAAAWLLTVGAAPSLPPVGTPAATPTPSPSHSPTPAPTPNSNGVLSLSVSLGPPGTITTVTGSGFRPNEPVTIYWDSPDHVVANQTADGTGSFKFDLQVPAGDPGEHMICPLEPNSAQICVQFKLEAPAPSPSPSASASASPTPLPSASPSASATPVLVPDGPTSTDRPSAVAALLQPPFVIFPVLVLLALVGGCAYWIWAGTRRQAPMPSATVVHRSVRPGGQPLVTPPPMAAEPPPAAPPEPAAPPPPPDLPTPRPAADDRVDLPEPGD